MPVPAVVQGVTAAISAALLLGAAQPAPEAARAAFTRRLVAAAVARADVEVRYVADYVRIPYPGGDVPPGTGVCADEVIRIYRAVGVDLQQAVHEDIVRAPSAYALSARPDPSIDHRRVRNLVVHFRRAGEPLPVSDDPDAYRPGDLVVWDLVAGHIGMVVDWRDPASGRPLLLHNVGRGPKIEDVLLAWPILGHYRYWGPPGAPRT